MDVPSGFLRTVSHELRNPLTAASGYLDLLAEVLEPEDATARHYLAKASDGLRSIQARVAEMSAAGEAARDLAAYPVSVAHIVRASVARAVEHAEAREIELVTAGSSHEIRVTADAGRLGRALDQLLSNALKFSPRGSRVEIAHSQEAGLVAITVSDEGPGIPPAERTRVFEPFYRSPFAEEAAIPGLGLGLTVARKIAAAHGGGLVIDDGARSGTRVTLTIPALP
jgi:signal transduction histidine kinase